MKFSCTQENLHQGLAIASHIANKNLNLPILGNVLIKCEEGVLRLMATNLELAVSCMVRGKVERPGEFTVPSKLFTDFIALLPKERVDVESDGTSLSISCGSYQTKMNGIPASEFPLIPTLERTLTFTVDADALRRAISQVLFAVAANESRPEISGVYVKFAHKDSGYELVLAATDSYRLAEKIIPVTESKGTDGSATAVIVPGRTIAELGRILSTFKDGMDLPETIEVAVSENQILFAYNNAELVSRTIEGKYPDYRQLIPDRFETQIHIPKSELLRAVKTTSLFSRTGLNDVHFTFTPDKGVRVSATNSTTGEQVVDLDGDIQGKENKLTVNFKYFLDGVNNIEAEYVALQMIDSISPCLLRPTDTKTVTPGYLYIVMPIRQ